MAYYPVFLELKGRRCLVIGGGRVAEGKVQGLLEAEAEVTVLAPAISPALSNLLAAGKIKHTAREYADGDLEGYDLCFIATDDGSINAAVAAAGRKSGVWVNAADDPANCDFMLPSVVRQGQVVLAASTGGASPALARRLREELRAFLSEDFAPLAELLAEARAGLKKRGQTLAPEAWQRAIDARLRALLAQDRVEEARRYLLERLGLRGTLKGQAGEDEA